MKTKDKELQQSKQPLSKSDFEAVLKAATKPLKKEQVEKESEETSEPYLIRCGEISLVRQKNLN
jgi:hypothetical protein